jgi:hypothetical protein
MRPRDFLNSIADDQTLAIQQENSMSNFPAHVTTELSFDGVIKKGDRGAKVRRVQEWLTFNKFATSIDGDFGDATKTCVTNFQRSKGLPETGSVNQQTWEPLIAPLNKALAPIEFGANTQLSDAILRVAKQHLSQHPVEVGGQNRGPWVRTYMSGHQGPEWLWCGGFVTFVMKQACMLLNRQMPIEGSFSCDSLAHQGKEAGLFVKDSQMQNGSVTWQELGAAQVFLVRRTSTDWVHTGFSFDGEDTVFSTIEGNTDRDGSSNGFEVAKRTRSIPKKDFIRLS